MAAQYADQLLGSVPRRGPSQELDSSVYAPRSPQQKLENQGAQALDRLDQPRDGSRER